jgi:hypothetical protein
LGSGESGDELAEESSGEVGVEEVNDGTLSESFPDDCDDKLVVRG